MPTMLFMKYHFTSLHEIISSCDVLLNVMIAVLKKISRKYIVLLSLSIASFLFPLKPDWKNIKHIRQYSLR